MNSKIGKGIWIMISVIIAAYQTGTNVWPIAVITAVLTGIGYYISNLWVVSNSPAGELNVYDIIKGAILAVTAALLSSIVTFFDGSKFDWEGLGMAALGAFVAYVSATFFAPASTKVAK